MSINQGSVILITGAGSGIGRALAVSLAGLDVAGLIISDIDGERLEMTAGEIANSGTESLAIEADVSDRTEIERLVDEATARFGYITHLINNAGVGLVGRVTEVSLEDMEWLMGINFWGTIFGTKAVLPMMRARDEGHIINISSVFGLIAPPGQATYCASKFAVRGFTESLRHELEGTNISVSCVHPGGVLTNISRDSRKGKDAPVKDKEIAPVIFEKVARTTAEDAAEIIIKGIMNRSPRILIGSDAAKMSVIARIVPVRYFKIMDRISGGMLSKFR